MSARVRDIERALRHYRGLRAIVPVGPLRSRRAYQKAVGMLDALLEAIGEAESHPLADLAETLGVFIERYEQEHVPMPAAKPAEVFRFLMDQHQLRQADLREVGSQGVVSEILSGRRQLDARQARRLAERFGVSPAVFLWRAHLLSHLPARVPPASRRSRRSTNLPPGKVVSPLAGGCGQSWQPTGPPLARRPLVRVQQRIGGLSMSGKKKDVDDGWVPIIWITGQSGRTFTLLIDTDGAGQVGEPGGEPADRAAGAATDGDRQADS